MKTVHKTIAKYKLMISLWKQKCCINITSSGALSKCVVKGLKTSLSDTICGQSLLQKN